MIGIFQFWRFWLPSGIISVGDPATLTTSTPSSFTYTFPTHTSRQGTACVVFPYFGRNWIKLKWASKILFVNRFATHRARLVTDELINMSRAYWVSTEQYRRVVEYFTTNRTHCCRLTGWDQWIDCRLAGPSCNIWTSDTSRWDDNRNTNRYGFDRIQSLSEPHGVRA